MEPINALSHISHAIKLSFALLLMMSVTACGFHLRGSQALPENLTQVLIIAPMQYSPLSRALQKRLPVYQLKGVINPQASMDDASAQQTVVVELQPEQFERKLLSVFTTGQVAEYELIYTVNYSVLFPDALPIENTLTVSREYQDDPDQILAKSRELNLILAELRSESADQLIRLLSSQFTLSKIESTGTQAN